MKSGVISGTQHNIVIAATFSAEFLLPSLNYYAHRLGLDFSFLLTPYNHVIQELISPDSLMQHHADAICVMPVRFADWLRYRESGADRPSSGVLSSDHHALLESSFASFSDALRSSRAATPRRTLVLVCPSARDGEEETLFAGYAERLRADCARLPAVSCLTAADYHAAYGVTRIYDPVGDTLGHIPFHQDYVHFLGTLIVRFCYGVTVPAKKVIVVDCDNTIWHGVCGEAGPAGVGLKGTAAALQRFLVDQKERGLLLCLCSKNTENDVWAVFDSRADMYLKKKHLTASRINWEPKSKNIQSLAQELGLDLESFIFIDDNELECAEVKSNAPEVFTLHWPPAGDDPIRALSQLWLFDRFTLTAEDRERTALYRTDIARRQAAETAGDWQSFLDGLRLVVEIKPVAAPTMERASQMTMRTNQFNFTTRRMAVGEITSLSQAPGRAVRIVEARDRFGDYGICGLVAYTIETDRLAIDTFLLSCRVLGRGVEHILVSQIAAQAVENGKRKVSFLFQDSEKNRPARMFIDWLAREYGGTKKEAGRFVFESKKLAGCSYRHYSAAPPLTKTEGTPPRPIGDQKTCAPADLIEFWTAHDTLEKITRRIELFRKEGAEPRPDTAATVANNGAADRAADVFTIADIFAKYSSLDRTQLSAEVSLESLALASRDIVSITSELNLKFDGVSYTLLFECRTFGEICDRLLGKKNPAQAEPMPGEGRQRRGQTAPRPESSENAMGTTGAADIAVIGISCRLPGARNAYELWDNLVRGVSSISEIPAERWDAAAFYSREESDPHKSYSRWGGFIRDVDRFDAAFFNIPPRQAELMDPQQRIFLEIVWNLIEDAGYNPERFEKKTGVFAGVISSDYGLYQNQLCLDTIDTFRNCDYYAIANRISYFFDFHGPSMVIDTACSASGTALHVACESLWAGGCRAAVVGGINLILHPSRFVQYSHVGMLSRDDRCRPFAQDATGTVIGEGAGALLLKPYVAAQKDGDHIWGVIKGSAVNSGGRTTGFTVPNPDAQSEVVAEAFRRNGIDAATVSYVEAHGTGTPLGDPIEIAGLQRAFDRESKMPGADRAPCAIGSIKSNIGHLESAAATAGIIKVLLQMRYETLVPSLHAEIANEKIDFAHSPFRIQTQSGAWTRPTFLQDGRPITYPLRAGVSSFGAGGSNSHVIIEEPARPADDRRACVPGRQSYLAVFSAQTSERLGVLIANVASFLKTVVPPNRGEFNKIYTIENIAYTFMTGRKAMGCRMAIIAASPETLIAQLEAYRGRSGDAALPGIFESDGRDPSALAQIVRGGAGRAFQETLARENDLETLARFWVAGGELEAHILFGAVTPSRVSLPGTPFAGPRYWMENCRASLAAGETSLDSVFMSAEKAGLPTEQPVAAPAVPRPEKRFYLFKKKWRKTNAGALPVSIKQLQGDVVIFGCAAETARELLRALDQLDRGNHRIIFISKKSERFRLPKKHGFEMRLVSRLDDRLCSRMLDRLAAQNRAIGHIVFVADFAANGQGNLDNSFFPLFGICRRLLAHNANRACRLLYFYPGSRECADPFFAGLTGFGKTVSEENPAIDFRTVRVDSIVDRQDNHGGTQIADAIWSELAADRTGKDVAYDNEGRWTACYTEIDRSRAGSDSPTIVPHDGGNYLITGGMGSLGLAVAGKIAAAARATVILVDRYPLGADGLEKIARLKEMAAEIFYIEADITRPSDVRRMTRIVKRWIGKITGIFHCAGAIRDALLVDKQPAETRTVLSAKVQGTRLLDQATLQEDLDFFVLFSSLSALVGNPGQSDYAYANCFLDGFKDQRNALVKNGLRQGLTISINWPHWQDGGMKLSESARALFTAETGLNPLPTALGLEILDTVLSEKIAHAIPAFGNADVFEKTLNAEAAGQKPEPELAPLVSDDALHADGGALAQTDIDATRAPTAPSLSDEMLLARSTATLLRQALAEVMKIDPAKISDDTRFETLGLDSIGVRMFTHVIERQIGKISKTLLYECASLRVLAEYFLRHYHSQLAAFFGKGKKTAAAGSENSLQAGAARLIREPRPEASRGKPGSNPSGEIALIGLSGAYPQAKDPVAFWNNLKNGKDCVTQIPEERWDNRRYFSEDKHDSVHGKYYCPWGGFLDNIGDFDPLFFSIAPKEARAMDPQERLFLQHAWTAVEDAGYSREELASLFPDGGGANVGVFVGVTTNDYQLIGAEKAGMAEVVGRSLSWSIANRVSFALNLTGPSLPVDSACSSALTAVHLACESLKSGECGAAIVGAVNLFLHPFKYILNSSQRMLSAAGRCRTFSAEADGFVPAEGVGAFLLVPLETALRNGDHIYALIKGTAINHGGRTNGFTVPNPEAQAEVIEKAMAAAGIHPRTVTYLEAHGTGTALGDPIEIDGLTKAFEKYTADKGYCAVGSVKSNIGHAEAAAGAASLTKVILQFRHRWIAPTLYADRPNPDIDFPSTPFFLRSEGGPWPRPVIMEKGETVEYPRRAGISSFGAGGVNAHIIVEEYREMRAQYAPPEPGETLIVLSALSREQLRTSARQLAEFLETGERENGPARNVTLADVAYTLQVGRVSLRERVALIVSSPGELAKKLSAFAADESVPPGVWTGRAGTPQDSGKPQAFSQALQNRDLSLLARAWIEGAVIPWKQLYPDLSSRRRLSLPTAPFRARRYWIDDLVPAAGRGEETTAADPAGQDQTTVARPAPLDQPELVEGFSDKTATRRSPSRAIHHLPNADNSHTDGLETAFPIPPPGAEFSLTGKMVEAGHGKTEFTMNVSLDACAYLKAHRLFGRAVLSGPTQLAMLFEAAYRMLSSARIEIRHMSFIQPIAVAESERRALVLEVNRAPGSQYNFVFRSRRRDAADGEWTIHSSGTLSDNRDAPTPAIDPAEWKSPGTREKSIVDFYRRLEDMGYRFEPSFKHLTHLAANETIAVASITGAREENEYSAAPQHGIHIMDPGIIDSCIQTLLPVLPEHVTREKPHSIYVPVFISGFSLYRPLTVELVCRAKRIEWDDKKETLLGSLLLQGTTGDLIGKIDKFRLKRVHSERLLRI